MKRFLFFLLISYSLTSHATEGYLLKGTINGNYTGTIYLSTTLGKDSSQVQNNVFEFKGKVDKPVMAWLHLKGMANAAWVYLENNTITVTGDFSIVMSNNEPINFYDIKQITGSYSQKLFDEYNTFCSTIRKEENFDALRFTELKQIFSANSRLSVSGYILSGLILSGANYSYDEFLELFTLLDAAEMQQGDVSIIRNGLRTLNLYGVGQAFATFKLPNQVDKSISSEVYRGNITLIDFWASWCKPCRAKHPELVLLQKKYQAAGVKVVSISIDKDRTAWRKAIVQDGLSWDNLLDAAGQLKNELSIPAIPFNYLLDEHGNILAVNQSLEKINLILEQKLK